MFAFASAGLRVRFLYSLGISLSLFFLTYLIFGYYYSEYEGLNIALLSGSLTPELPFRSVYFSGNLVISWFYSFLYEMIPSVEWISWLEYAFMLISCTLVIFLLLEKLSVRFSSIKKAAVILAVFLLVFIDHQVHLIYTRVAYLACGISLISLVVTYEKRVNKPFRNQILLNVFFLLGALIRNEAAIATVLLALPFSLFYLTSIKQTARIFLFPTVVVLFQSLILTSDIKGATNKEFYKQVEPDIEEQFIARDNMVPLSEMKTARDSALYGMASEMTFSDPQILSSEYLRSLIKPEGFLFTDSHQWRRVCTEFYYLISDYWYLALIIIFLGASIALQIDFRLEKQLLLYYLIFVLSFWVLCIAQTYVDKVNERSWIPYSGMFILCNVFLLIKYFRSPNTRLFSPLIISIFILTLISTYKLSLESRRMKEHSAFQEKQFDIIKSEAKGNILVTNSSVFNFLFLSNKPFHPFSFTDFKKIYITDSYIIPFLPYYKRYLEKECGCDIYQFPSFWRYLKSKSSEVRIVSRPDRLETIKNYSSVVHSITIQTEVVSNPSLRELRLKNKEIDPDDLKIYRLKTD